MIEIGMFDAKTHLPEIIRRVQAGEEFCLTKHHKKVAFIVSTSQYYQNKNEELFHALSKLKKRVPLGSVDDIISMRDESRK